MGVSDKGSGYRHFTEVCEVVERVAKCGLGRRGGGGRREAREAALCEVNAAYKGAPPLLARVWRDACHVPRSRVLLIAFNKRVARYTCAARQRYKSGVLATVGPLHPPLSSLHLKATLVVSAFVICCSLSKI